MMQMMTGECIECKMSIGGYLIQPRDITEDVPEDMTCEWMTGVRQNMGLFPTE